MRLIKYIVPVLLFSFTLTAQFPGGGPPPGDRGDRENGAQFEAVQEALQLSPEQIQQLQDINAAFREAAQPDREQIRTLQTQLRDEFQSDNPNAAVIGQIQLDIRNLQSQISDKQSEVFAAGSGRVDAGASSGALGSGAGACRRARRQTSGYFEPDRQPGKRRPQCDPPAQPAWWRARTTITTGLCAAEASCASPPPSP